MRGRGSQRATHNSEQNKAAKQSQQRAKKAKSRCVDIAKERICRCWAASVRLFACLFTVAVEEERERAETANGGFFARDIAESVRTSEKGFSTPSRRCSSCPTASNARSSDCAFFLSFFLVVPFLPSRGTVSQSYRSYSIFCATRNRKFSNRTDEQSIGRIMSSSSASAAAAASNLPRRIIKVSVRVRVPCMPRCALASRRRQFFFFAWKEKTAERLRGSASSRLCLVIFPFLTTIIVYFLIYFLH